jgi:hypothetical protein
MKVGLCIAKRTTFHFNIAIAELIAVKRNRPVPDAISAYRTTGLVASLGGSRRLSRRCDGGVAPA